MGTLHRSGAPRRTNENAKLVITTIVAMVFGFFIGITLPSVSFTKINLPSGFISSLDGGRSPEDFGSRHFPKIYVPTNPHGAELLPPGIVVAESDFYLRRLWGEPSEDLKKKPKYLVTFTVGFEQRNNINAAVKKFSEDFQILLFHYDGRTTEWDQFEWSKNAIHISAKKQTKWWYAKRFLHPDVVSAYEYIFIWDEDLGVEHFNAERYIELVKKHGLEISQPGLEPNNGLTWEMTKRRGDRDVHKETQEKPGWCSDPHLPPCAAFVEIMAPVFSREAWRCVWHMIQCFCSISRTNDQTRRSLCKRKLEVEGFKMASTGEPDRKKRHFSSISPTEAAAAVKKQPFFWPSSEDKLDTAVLQFQNLKLSQKLEAQQVECSVLEDRLSQIKDKQLPYSSSLKTVHKSWDKLTDAVESRSVRVSGSSSGAHISVNKEDGSSPDIKDDFINRLLETGATESSSSSNICSNGMEEGRGNNTSTQVTQTLHNLVAATNDIRCLKDELYPTVLKAGLDKELCGQQLALNELDSEVKSFRVALDDVLVKFKSLSRELQSYRDADARVRADLKRIRGELEDEVVELQQCNGDLSALRAERDATAGAFFPVLSPGNKLASSDKTRDKQRDLQDMEAVLKELTVLASSRLQELKELHKERTKVLERTSILQNKSKSVRGISSSQACLSLKDQLRRSKEAVFKYMALLEKLQVEKDSLFWKERELNIKNELVDVSRRTSAVADSRMASLDVEIQKQHDEKTRIRTRLGNISKERGRKELFADTKALVSSFPGEMSSMRSQLSSYKETAGGIHSLRADVQSLSGVLCRKGKECEALHLRSAGYASQLRDLNATVRDLKNSHEELQLFLDMFKRESTDPRDIAEAREQEYMAWAHVESLKSSLDEQNLELRVKAANEAEAVSQQMLAAAEAEIADLRQRMDDCKRDVAKHSDVLKSKNEEHGTYLSEIQTIGSAYEDIVPQNQQLLLQVTERDDYNIKLYLEGIASRQMQDALLIDKYIMDKDIQQASASASFLSKRSLRIEDQMRLCTDQYQRLAEDRYQKSITLENLQKKRADVGNGLEQARSKLEESHSRVEKSRVDYGALELELETERFNRRRIEEDMETAKKKVSRLRSLIEGSSATQKLRQELSEFKEILKCKACNDRSKEVVITKCFHLFCNPCVQKIIGTRQRKCPTCSASFGPNDIKPIYI